MSFFAHPQSICEAEEVGAGTRIWAFAHVLPGARIGADCNICDHVFVENDVVVGDRVTVKSGVQLWDGVRIEDDVFVGPNATFTNDKFPRSKQHPEEFPRTVVETGASIGANATILPGLRLGHHCMVGAGAVVTSNVPPNAIVAGNPARIVGYVDAMPRPLDSAPVRATTPGDLKVTATGVSGVNIHRFKRVTDLRGSLTVAEVEEEIPFEVKRWFMVYDVPSTDVRGEHAHRTCHQLLVAAHGRVSVIVDDGTTREQIELDSPEFGVHVPPLVWGTQYAYSPDAVLLVFASQPYDPDDYIRDHREYLALVGR